MFSTFGVYQIQIPLEQLLFIKYISKAIKMLYVFQKIRTYYVHFQQGTTVIIIGLQEFVTEIIQNISLLYVLLCAVIIAAGFNKEEH